MGILLSFFGHSVPAGKKASSYQNSYAGLMTVADYGVDNSMYADVVNRMEGFGYPTPVNPYVLVQPAIQHVFCGINDVRKYLNNTAQQLIAQNCLRRVLAYLACPQKVFARNMQQTAGQWSDTAVNNFGLFSTVQSAQLTCEVSGNAIYIGYIVQDNSQVSNGTANVFVDSQLVATISTFGVVDTYLGNTYAGAAIRVPLLSVGTHRVDVQVTSSNGQYFYLDWIAGNQQAYYPCVPCADIPLCSAAGYASLPGVTPSLIDQYNSMIYGVQGQAVTDGLNVPLLPARSIIDPNTMLDADGIHPNDAGHLALNFGLWRTVGACV